MDNVYLSFSFSNWVTVVIMAALGFMALSLFAQFWYNRSAS